MKASCLTLMSLNAFSNLLKTNHIQIPAEGNELSGNGVGASVGATQYGEDLINLKSIINDLYKNSDVKPLLLAPGGFFDLKWYARFLNVSGLNTVNALTHHLYNLGAGGLIIYGFLHSSERPLFYFIYLASLSQYVSSISL